jgi:hypothetical protein
VDVLRFGEGAASENLGGFAKHTMRLIGIMGPLGKAAKCVQVATKARVYVANREIIGGNPDLIEPRQ